MGNIIFYPLKEKQNIEIERINTENDAITLNYEIKETAKKVEELKTTVNSSHNGDSLHTKLKELEDLIYKNQISQFSLERRNQEIITRKKHIKLYNTLFWVFFPIGILISIFGFTKWLKSKTIDDEILSLEKKKLELEINKLLGGEENSNRTTLVAVAQAKTDKIMLIYCLKNSVFSLLKGLLASKRLKLITKKSCATATLYKRNVGESDKSE